MSDICRNGIEIVKRMAILFLAFIVLISGCGVRQISEGDASLSEAEDEILDISSDTGESESADIYQLEEYEDLDDADLLVYVENIVYSDLIDGLDSADYFVENVSATYISKEYLEENAYNSQSNIYFGYTLEELEEEFQDTGYIFTLGDDGTTAVQAFEGYDDTYDQIVRNVAVGAGVILLCVTVSVVSGGAGAPAVSMIFAASAKTGTAVALSSGVFSGVAAGIVTGIETSDFDESVKAAELAASEGFMWGAITGTIAGGASEAVALHGATLGGLTMKEAATIQKESGYPLDIISQFHNMDEYEVYKNAGLYTEMVNGKIALIQDIDLDFVSELPDGTEVTNLTRMQMGYAPIDPETGLAYQLHHIGQNADGTLAVLTQEQHQGNSAILNIYGKESEINRSAFANVREEFWEYMGNVVFAG